MASVTKLDTALKQAIGIPVRYHGYDREQWVRWKDNWPLESWRKDPPWAVTVIGPVGTGKTSLATAAMMEYMVETARWAWWIDWATALESMKREFGGTERTAEKLHDERMLLLDDVGINQLTDWSSEVFRNTINYRYAHTFPTIVTMNAETMGDLDDIDPRSGSRLSEGEVLVLQGSDQRLEVTDDREDSNPS
jgi:DNA replication protein DnaC